MITVRDNGALKTGRLAGLLVVGAPTQDPEDPHRPLQPPREYEIIPLLLTLAYHQAFTVWCLSDNAGSSEGDSQTVFDPVMS